MLADYSDWIVTIPLEKISFRFSDGVDVAGSTALFNSMLLARMEKCLPGAWVIQEDCRKVNVNAPDGASADDVDDVKVEYCLEFGVLYAGCDECILPS